MADVAIDARPLQGGDAGRGIGTYIRGIVGKLEPSSVICWSRAAAPEGLEHVRRLDVPARAYGGRLGWVANLAASRAALTRVAGPIHLTSPDARYSAGNIDALTIYDAIPMRFPTLYPSGRFGRLRQSVEKSAARSAKAVITISTASAEDIAHFYGVPEARIRVIPPGADDDFATGGDVEKVRLHLGLPQRYVVASGGFAFHDPRKRLGDALRCLRQLPDDVHLAVTGSAGIHAEPFVALANELKVASRLNLTGQLSRGDLAALFRGAAVFVFPSLWEGFGLPLLDAFVAGTPAVVSDGGALPEVAGRAAAIYPVGDVEALVEHTTHLLTNDSAAAELAERGRARAKVFTWERAAAEHADVYRGL